MMDAWFSPEGAYLFAAAGVLCLTALAAPAIAKGRYKALVMTIWGGIIVAGLGLVAAGGLAIATGQPPHVTLPLLVTGFAMALAYGISILFVSKAYQMAEHRKVAAREL